MRQRSAVSSRPATHPPWWKAIAFAALFVCAAVPPALAPAGPEPGQGAGTAGPVSAEPPRREPAPRTTEPPLPHDEREQLTALLDEYLSGRDSRLSIALHDLATGAAYSYRSEDTYTAASLVKLNILAILLLRTDDEGRELLEWEHDLASRMIRYSDNGATDTLYSRIGFDDGFAAGNERLGLRATEPGRGGVWGATQTTTADQIRLLRVVFTETGPLSKRSRRYARDLLGSVAPEQAWGVSAAAEDGDSVELKNGWVPRSADGDRWVITSAGRVAGADHDYLIAVLSDRHHDYHAGIECVEHVVAEVASALKNGAP